MNSVTPRGFMRMNEDFLEFDYSSEEQLDKVLDNARGNYATFPIRDFNGYLEIMTEEYKETGVLRMTVESGEFKTVCRCFIFGVPTSRKIRSAFSSMKGIISETERDLSFLGYRKDDLSFLGYRKDSDGRWRRDVRPNLFFLVAKESPWFSIESLFDKLNLSDFDGVVFFTSIFQHSLYFTRIPNDISSCKLITSSTGMSPILEMIRFECEEFEKNMTVHDVESFHYGKMDHYSNLPSVLRDFKVNPPKTRLIGKDCYRFALKEGNDFKDGFIHVNDLELRKGAMETCIL